MTQEQAINTVVNWWSNKLKQKSPHSNGDSGAASVFGCFLADINMRNISEHQLSTFEKELYKEIKSEIENRLIESRWHSLSVGCDYDPCRMLSDAAKKADISTWNFPYKTWMSISIENDDLNDGFQVRVSDGYRAEWVSLSPVN